LQAALAALGGAPMPETPPASAPPTVQMPAAPAPQAPIAPPTVAPKAPVEHEEIAKPQTPLEAEPVVQKAPAPPAPKPRSQPAPDTAWLAPDTKTPVLKEKWSGKVKEVTLGATEADGGTRSKSVTVGGETAMPFMHFEGVYPHAPLIAVEVCDRPPDDWSQLLMDAWGSAAQDPGQWARAAEAAGTDLIQLSLSLLDADGHETTPDQAIAAVRNVLDATGLPVMVFGPGQAERDNALLVPVAEAFKGERLVLGVCEDKNYRTIIAAALANDHIVSARTAMDVNLAKQLNILISDMGLPLDRVIMDPTTGALGYGFEYGYSVMERLRLSALQGDVMTQLPMIVTPGEECWKTKESKVGEGVPQQWGAWRERAINWETVTATMLIESGANIVVLRHPESVKRVRLAIDDLSASQAA
jgi:acetyl-CoA decarbonylase/synthase complex subunit delta